MRRTAHHKTKKTFNYLKIFIPIILLLVIVLTFFIFKNKSWNGVDKFSYVSSDTDGNVTVTVLDPKLLEVTKIKIPSDTEVNVARNYGVLKIKNVWQLGVNEKIGGKLLAETVTKNFLFPVTNWQNDDDSNINFIDKIKINIFLKKINDIDKTEIDMGKGQFLIKAKLEDGTSGFKLPSNISGRLTSYFADTNLAEKNIKISIVDGSGKSGLAENLGAILEVIGGKIVSIDKKQNMDEFDCTVTGANNNAVENVNNLFNCEIVKSETKFDLEIIVGKKFASRF